ncbi:MAG: DUF1840 domain-containing protein [Rubrivivax sp.]|nr:DUF1840 domain-containing protein [Rubrivivax sp.]
MLYKFKSAATGDLIMLGPHGDAMLRLLGREPAPKGIIEAHDLRGAIAALRAAIEQAERKPEGSAAAGAADDSGEGDGGAAVSLRRRLWPVIEMLERAARADVPVVWGV